jgi:hypothetical protein
MVYTDYINNLRIELHSNTLGEFSTYSFLHFISYVFLVLQSQMIDIVDMAIQVGGAREGQSFVLKT